MDGPTIPIGALTLYSHSFLPVCLSNAKITPDFIVLAGFVDIAVVVLDFEVAFSVKGIYPANTMSSVTKGETLGGNTVWYSHLIFPVLRSIAAIVPLRNPSSIVCGAATLCPAAPL